MAAPKQGILSLTIRDKSALYAAYMPFIKNGGLFIPTAKSYYLGDEVLHAAHADGRKGENANCWTHRVDHTQRCNKGIEPRVSGYSSVS